VEVVAGCFGCLWVEPEPQTLIEANPKGTSLGGSKAPLKTAPPVIELRRRTLRCDGAAMNFADDLYVTWPMLHSRSCTLLSTLNSCASGQGLLAQEAQRCKPRDVVTLSVGGEPRCLVGKWAEVRRRAWAAARRWQGCKSSVRRRRIEANEW
jgi:hypothetical protein